jgi:membrane glycosyltransferase
MNAPLVGQRYAAASGSIAKDALPALPTQAPLPMPVQSLTQPVAKADTPDTSPVGMIWRRILLLTGAASLTALADYGAWDTFAHDGLLGLEVVALLLFTALCGGISLWFCSSVAGFWVMMRRRRDDLGLQDDAELVLPQTRSAILVPIRNEDSRAVFARLAAMDRDLNRLGASQQFDFFVLSDTSDAATARLEEGAWQSMRSHATCPVYYRRRLENTERKAGNIADWIRRFGAAYETMVVLDADSLMSGETIIRLAQCIESHPQVGVIQTMPVITGGQTLFARWLQFCTRLYGQVAATGLTWWTGSESIYWGHNAAIRVRAFASAAGLPQINREGVFGGTILSHDAIESSLIRRAGWAVHMAPSLSGSFEGVPPTLVEFASRDRRWCQGNVQHIPLIRTPGFHWISRMQLFVACMGYITSPLWLGFMTLGLWLSLTTQKSIQAAWHATFKGIEAGWTPPTDAWDFFQTIWLLALTTTMLLGPKVLGCIYFLTDANQAKSFGGRMALIKSLCVELVMSCALAPIMMVTQTKGLVEILLGRDAGWRLQNRDADGLSWSDAFAQHQAHMIVGLILGASVSTTPSLIIWMLPVVGPLLFSPVLARWSSTVAAGSKARREKLFMVPEETGAPLIITSATQFDAPAALAPRATAA